MSAEQVEVAISQDCLIIDYVLDNCHRDIPLSALFEEAKSIINQYSDTR